MAEHTPGAPAWEEWYLVAASLIFGIGLTVGYPWLIRRMGRRLDQAERANQVA